MTDQIFSDPINNETFELVSILLISHGDGSGDHLLFKYPFSNTSKISINKRNTYSLTSSDYLNFWITEKEPKLISNGLLAGLENFTLASLCMLNKNTSEPLELKIDNVFFLSSPNYLNVNNVAYNVVFAVKSPLPKPVIRCYQTLSLMISKALLKEEINNQYLTKQSRILLEDCLEDQTTQNISFSKAVKNCMLANELKEIFDNIRSDGIINIKINKRLELNFCLPHLAYKVREKCEQTFFVDAILNAKDNLRPYHGFLLIVSQDSLLKALPNDCNHYVQCILKMYNPVFSLARYAAELDVPISEVYTIIDHLIYWAKVKVIYPLTENNVYIVHPDTPTYVASPVFQAFNERFPDYSLALVLEQFSIAQSVVDHMDPKQSKEKHVAFLEIIIWLLERNLILQLHTYIYLLVKRTEHNRFCSKRSDNSFEDLRNDLDVINDHSLDFESTDSKDTYVRLYENYREILIQNKIGEKDQQFILKSFQNKTEQDIKLFLKLLPYFNGWSNLEEIIYYEKINRSDLIMLLDIFKDLLTICVHEDSNPIIKINVKIY